MPTLSLLNSVAQHFKSLHISGTPVLIPNTHDAHTAFLVARNPAAHATATASFPVALTHGFADHELPLNIAIAAVRLCARGIANAGRETDLPLSADLQDGYADPAESVRLAIAAGAVGCNIEDVDNSVWPLRLRGVEEAVGRIKEAMRGARESGVPDFVVNARTDVLGYGGTIEDVIARGKAFLEAGATTVFVWGVNKHVITEEEVSKMVQGLNGKLAVQPGVLGVKLLRECGVSRISVGPMFFKKAMETFEEEAAKVLKS